uniref:Uncharacterized protein n=1 Tax=Ananas comosus var. bracteatus TaxID=296719 RepID=A0A6V7PLB6_ANACO|nr:unnamed protein product [Ananas comosus var. bracteatus]
MLSEARSLPCFQLVFDVATFKSSIGSVKLDLEYSKYSRSSLTGPIYDSKVATSKTSWKHGRLRASDSIVARAVRIDMVHNNDSRSRRAGLIGDRPSPFRA